MLLKDVRELLYKDVDTDNGPSPIINNATDDIEYSDPLFNPDRAMPGEPIVELDPHQRVIQRTDANGHITRFEYEGLTVLSRIALADGTCFDFQYSDAGIIEKFLTGKTFFNRLGLREEIALAETVADDASDFFIKIQYHRQKSPVGNKDRHA